MKKFAVIFILGLISFMPADVPLSTVINQLVSYSGNPAGNIIVGSVAGVARKFNAGDFVDRSFHTGSQAINTVTGLQAALDAKQVALISGTTIKTVNGFSLMGAGNIPITGGSFNASDPQTRQSIAQISRDSAQNNIFPTSGKTFEIVDGKLFLRGERFTPTVQAGGTINSNAYGSFDPGSTDRAGVAQMIVTGTISTTDGTPLLLVSFGGTVYTNPPSITPAIGQTSPAIKIINVSTTGFTFAATGSFSLTAGTYKFPYHVEPL